MDISILGIDTAKQVFHLCGLNKAGKVVYRKKVQRSRFVETVVQIDCKLIAIEACGGSHHWARTFKSHDMDVKLIAPQFVKAYVKSNKTDMADAEAVAEAASRPTMRFVAVKNTEQQDLQTVHRVRERFIKQKVAVSNEIRGLLGEYGISFVKGFSRLKQFFSIEISEHRELSQMLVDSLFDLYREFQKAEKMVKSYDSLLSRIARNHPVAKRLVTVPGVGPICATACLAAVGSADDFKNGRQFASWVGLTPREHSSGGKQKLLGISKRGNSYLRKQLVHGARSVSRYAKNREDRNSLWLNGIAQRSGGNKAVVALANKNARILWSLMKTESTYQPSLAH